MGDEICVYAYIRDIVFRSGGVTECVAVAATIAAREFFAPTRAGQYIFDLPKHISWCVTTLEERGDMRLLTVDPLPRSKSDSACVCPKRLAPKLRGNTCTRIIYTPCNQGKRCRCDAKEVCNQSLSNVAQERYRLAISLVQLILQPVYRWNNAPQSCVEPLGSLIAYCPDIVCVYLCYAHISGLTPKMRGKLTRDLYVLIDNSAKEIERQYSTVTGKVTASDVANVLRVDKMSRESALGSQMLAKIAGYINNCRKAKNRTPGHVNDPAKISTEDVWKKYREGKNSFATYGRQVI